MNQNNESLTIDELKIGLRCQLISKAKFASSISSNRKLAFVKSGELEMTLWKLKKADFISNNEVEKHRQCISKTEQARREIDEYELGRKEYSVIENFIDVKQKLEQEKVALKCKLISLQISNDETKTTTGETRNELNILQKRNAALMLRLIKQKREVASQVEEMRRRLQILEAKLNDLLKERDIEESI